MENQNMGFAFDQVTLEKSFSKASCEENCSICLQQVESGIELRCHHIYHEPCIRHWFRRNVTCPTCRKPPCIILKRSPSTYQHEIERYFEFQLDMKRRYRHREYPFNSGFGIFPLQMFGEDQYKLFPEPVSSTLRNIIENRRGPSTVQSCDDSGASRSGDCHAEGKKQEYLVLVTQPLRKAVRNPHLPPKLLHRLNWMANLKHSSSSPTESNSSLRTGPDIAVYHYFDFIGVVIQPFGEGRTSYHSLHIVRTNTSIDHKIKK